MRPNKMSCDGDTQMAWLLAGRPMNGAKEKAPKDTLLERATRTKITRHLLRSPALTCPSDDLESVSLTQSRNREEKGAKNNKR
jgi:hypothetical protein